MAKKKAAAAAAETTEGAAPAAAEPKKKAPAKKKAAAAAAKPAASAKPAAAAGGASQQPLIDTNLAATNAAKMLLSKSKMGDPAAGAQPAKESGSFKQLKDSLKKPATATGLNAALGSTFGNGKSNLPLPGSRGAQQAHSQTQGNFNKFTVPRRTGG